MPALVAGIHVFKAYRKSKAWMAGMNPAMTNFDFDGNLDADVKILAETGGGIGELLRVGIGRLQQLRDGLFAPGVHFREARGERELRFCGLGGGEGGGDGRDVHALLNASPGLIFADLIAGLDPAIQN